MTWVNFTVQGKPLITVRNFSVQWARWPIRVCWTRLKKWKLSIRSFVCLKPFCYGLSSFNGAFLTYVWMKQVTACSSTKQIWHNIKVLIFSFSKRSVCMVAMTRASGTQQTVIVIDNVKSSGHALWRGLGIIFSRISHVIWMGRRYNELMLMSRLLIMFQDLPWMRETGRRRHNSFVGVWNYRISVFLSKVHSKRWRNKKKRERDAWPVFSAMMLS